MLNYSEVGPKLLNHFNKNPSTERIHTQINCTQKNFLIEECGSGIQLFTSKRTREFHSLKPYMLMLKSVSLHILDKKVFSNYTS